MASMEDRLNKLREERIAREKARIEKLREINRKKYSNNDIQQPKCSSSSVHIPTKSKPESSSSAIPNKIKSKSDTNCTTKNNANVFKRPITAAKDLHKKDIITGRVATISNVKPLNQLHDKKVARIENKHNGDVKSAEVRNNTAKVLDTIRENVPETTNIDQPKVTVHTVTKDSQSTSGTGKPLTELNAKSSDHAKKSNPKIPLPTQKLNGGSKHSYGNKVFNKNHDSLKARKSIAVIAKVDTKQAKAVADRRKTMLPAPTTNGNVARESVFDRLYKPKVVHKQPVDDVTKLKTDPNFLKKVIKASQMITTRRHTIVEQKTAVRRSISAIHFKRVRKSELSNCVHKWASVGEKMNTEHLQEANEDDCVNDEKFTSAVKSERKRVKFQTPLPLNFNTPKPEELQSRLRNWLQKRGKSLDSYHHLQCFGVHHLCTDMKAFNTNALKFVEEDENKENIALEHDSDNESYKENNNQNGGVDEEDKPEFCSDKWRRASNVSDTSDFNESYVSVLTSASGHHVEELLLGALNDLTELLREGFDWEQCARWLRAVRDRFPAAPDTAPYWECRAALEERRGDLHATVQCLEQAIAKGTEHSVVEANLDSLLDKFMQLKISPSCSRKQVDPKLVDVKNVFKSTIIRFAVQQAKLRQSTGTPKCTVTPVRRSNRLSRTQTPLRVCTTLHQARALGAEFKPNKALGDSP